jgi:tripartite ATP-independent transporter DctP family solute receptor
MKMPLAAIGRIILLGTLAAWAVAVGAQTYSSRTIKISVATATQHPLTIGAQKFADLVNQGGGGKLKARVYASGSIGSDVQVLSSLQGGTVEAMIVSVAPLTGMVKEYGLLALPGVFQDEKETDAVLDGPFGMMLNEKLMAHRLVGLAYYEDGFKHMTNSKRPITKWEDVAGLKFRVFPSPILLDVFNRLDSNPVPMPFTELYQALEQKAVDGMEGSLATVESSRLFEVQKFMSLTRYIYNPVALLFSKPVWDTLTIDDKKLIAEAAATASRYGRQVNRESEKRFLSTLQQKGIQVNEMSAQERARMRERLQPVIEKYTEAAGAAASREFFAEVAKARARAGSN